MVSALLLCAGTAAASPAPETEEELLQGKDLFQEEELLEEHRKVEKVFAVTDASGKVLSLTDTITLKNPEALDVLEDTTMLSDIENTGGDESFSLDGETITFQADGHEIEYQGTSDKPLPVTPTIEMLLDGKSVTAAQMEEGEGNASLLVQYPVETKLAYPTLSVIMLPESGISDIKTRNAALISLFGRQAVVGAAVPGADESLQLPDSFEVSFVTDHAAPEWMMTVSSADPVRDVIKQLEAWLSPDIEKEESEALLLMEALARGDETLPSGSGKTGEISLKIQDLFDGISELDSGAGTLADGARTLQEGMAALSENSDALNAGAQAIVDDILKTANEQLASSGLAEAGIQLPDLTEDNYADVLDQAIGQLNDMIADGGKDASGKSGEELSLTDKLALLMKAETALASLNSLKEKLDGLEEFKTGLSAYTDGVDQAAEGASSLADGASTLHDDGTSVLSGKLRTASSLAAEKILALYYDRLQPARAMLSDPLIHAKKAGYDLREEGENALTVFMIRTEL